MVVSAVPVAISAVSFGFLHLILKKGRCFKSLQRAFKRRQDSGEVRPGVSTETLASQAEARIVNEVHNVIVVRHPLLIQKCCAATMFWERRFQNVKD
jgi:hypothetical protein